MAQVLSIAAHKSGVAPGDERDKLNRRKGNRGRRIDDGVKKGASDAIRFELRTYGLVRAETRDRLVDLLESDKAYRRLVADVREALRKDIAADDGTDVAEYALFRLQPGKDGWTRKPELTPDLVHEVLSYPTFKDAWERLRKVVGHPLYECPRSTFYRLTGAIDPLVVEQVRKGERGGKLADVSVPLSPTEPFTKVTLDEFDIKVDAAGRLVVGAGRDDDAATATRFKFAQILDINTRLPLAYALSAQPFTSAQVAALYAESVVGWTRDGVEVFGAADWLGCDNAATFVSEELTTKLAYFATTADPTRSYTPQANGHIERLHRDYNQVLRQLPGNSRRFTAASGKPIDEPSLTFEQVAMAVEAMVNTYRFEFVSDQDGKTAWQRYAELVAEHGSKRRDVDDECIAHAALPVRTGSRKTIYKTHGRVVRFDGNRYLGTRLAESAVPEVELRRLLTHTDVLYAFTKDGSFLDVLVHEDLLDAATADALRAGRYARNRAVVQAAAIASELRTSEGFERVTGVSATGEELGQVVAAIRASGLDKSLAALGSRGIEQLVAAIAAYNVAETTVSDIDTGEVAEPQDASEPTRNDLEAEAPSVPPAVAAPTPMARRASEYDAMFGINQDGGAGS